MSVQNLIVAMIWGLALTLICCLIVACGGVFAGPGSDNFSDGGQGGEETLPEGVLHLPFAAGATHLCTQGAGGSYSHQGNSTFYGLDHDTDNSCYEDVFAPASGIVYVHYDTSLSGFGYHVNLDLGDGTHVVLGHLADVFVENGAEVTAGQFIGYEGCTGACTGDHVHLDLHQGDPQQMAQHGSSLLTSYFVRDVTSGSEPITLQSDQFICDLVNGHHYESQLPVTSWHPDGTLLKYPDSEEVFVVDGGDIHWIENEEVFESYGFYWDDVVLMSEHELWCWDENGSVISEPTQYQAVRDETGTTWIAFEQADDPGRYRQLVHSNVEPEVLNSWGIQITHGATDQEGSHLLSDYPIVSGNAHMRDGALVQEYGSSVIHVIHEGRALPIKNWETFLLLGFESRFIFSIPGGNLDLVASGIGSCETNIGCISSELVSSCGDVSLVLPGSDDHPEGDDDTVSDDDDSVSDDDDTTDPVEDDDTDIGDDDDTTDPIGDDDDDDIVSDDDDSTEIEDDWLLLEIEGHLDGAFPDYLLLEGELLDENDSPAGGGFWWSELVEVTNNPTLHWSAYVLSGWTFRHSFEYERYGVTSWSCLAPYPPGTITMDLNAWVEGTPVTVQSIDNHLGGCELLVEVP